MRGLPRLVALTPIGKDVDVEVLRKGQHVTIRVAVGRLAEEASTKTSAKEGKEPTKEPPKGKGRSKDKDKEGKATGPALIGLVLAPLTDELRTKHNISSAVNGLIVLEIDPSSPIAEKGIKVGDVIVEVAQEAVTSVDDITRGVDKVKKAGRRAVLLRVEDGQGDTRFVAVPVQ